nr:JAB domain-containing protein [Salinivibrio sp. ML198]
MQFDILSFGTIGAAPNYPREVAKAALSANAAAVIFVNNHRSRIAKTSQANRHITNKFIKALSLSMHLCRLTQLHPSLGGA